MACYGHTGACWGHQVLFVYGAAFWFLLIMGVLFCCGAAFFIRRRMYPPPLVDATGIQQSGMAYYADPEGMMMNPMAMSYHVQPKSPQMYQVYPPPSS